MLGNLAVGHSPLVRRPTAPEVSATVVATVVAVVAVVALVAVVEGGPLFGPLGPVFVAVVVVVVVVAVTFFAHLSFLPTFLQIRGLDAVPAKAPALEQLPPTLAADTCWVGMMIAKTLATTSAIILRDLNMAKV